MKYLLIVLTLLISGVVLAKPIPIPKTKEPVKEEKKELPIPIPVTIEWVCTEYGNAISTATEGADYFYPCMRETGFVSDGTLRWRRP